MVESILQYLLDLKKDEDRIILKIIWKLLYFISCIIISFYIAEHLGYKYVPSKLSYDTVINFFASYAILIPIFCFIFTVFVLAIVDSIINTLVLVVSKIVFNKYVL